MLPASPTSDDLLSRLFESFTMPTSSPIALFIFDWASSNDVNFLSISLSVSCSDVEGEGGNGTFSAIDDSVGSLFVTTDGISVLVVGCAFLYTSRQYVDGSVLLSGLIIGSVTLGMFKICDIGCC